MSAGGGTLMRIGELARRTGMAEATLRAWERRYGIPQPQRTVGGHRLYSEQDVARLARVQRLVEQGWAVGSAARRVGRELGGARVAVVAHRPERPGALADRLVEASRRFDVAAGHSTLDDAFRGGAATGVLGDVVEPMVARLHADATGSDPTAAAVAHFALALLRGRLAGLLFDVTTAAGDPLVVAAAQGEGLEVRAQLHAIALAEGGWSVRYLGADVDPAAVVAAAAAVGARAMVVVADEPAGAKRFLSTVKVPDGSALLVAGPGFAGLPGGSGVHHLSGGVAEVADEVRERGVPA